MNDISNLKTEQKSHNLCKESLYHCNDYLPLKYLQENLSNSDSIIKVLGSLTKFLFEKKSELFIHPD